MKLLVGNLTEDTTKRDIREAFAEYGEVARVAITSKSRGGYQRFYGLVEMRRTAEGKTAVENLHGSIFGDRVLKVREMRSRKGGRSGSAPSIES